MANRRRPHDDRDRSADSDDYSPSWESQLEKATRGEMLREEEDRRRRRHEERGERTSEERERREHRGRSRSRSRERRHRRSPDYEGYDRDRRRSPARHRRRSASRDRSRTPPHPGQAVLVAGEWYCHCGALNFKRRVSCFRQYCGAPKSEAIAAGVPQSLPGAPQPPGKPVGVPAQFAPEDIPRLAAYSAQVYAASPAEQAHYLRYYTLYYTQQLAGAVTEADKVNAAAAVAQSAISQLHARSAPPMRAPDGSDGRVYPAPDTTAYLYDESSGFYYDPATGLYYDAATQYYYNSQIGQYLYWDAPKMTYSLAAASAGASSASVASQPVPAEPAPSSAAAPAADPPPEEKKKEKSDKVKVAKKIAKDMERWAKTMNQKKEAMRAGAAAEAAGAAGPAAGSADIGFSVLESRATAAPPAPPAPPALVPSYGAGSDSEGDEDEGIIDWSKLACLLCKRQFPSREVLEKHQSMSELHRKNLEAFRRTRAAADGLAYRDRAAERRLKYGEDEQPAARPAPRGPAPPASAAPEIGEDNVGNRLLKKMGWSAGQGLGKEGQGRVGPVLAHGGQPGMGLGQWRGIYTPGSGETYRGCLKKLTMARYRDLLGSEGNT